MYYTNFKTLFPGGSKWVQMKIEGGVEEARSHLDPEYCIPVCICSPLQHGIPWNMYFGQHKF